MTLFSSKSFPLISAGASKIDCFKNLSMKSLDNGYFGALIFQEIAFFEHLKYNFKTS